MTRHVRVSLGWIASIVSAASVVLLASCGDDAASRADDDLITNADGTFTVAAEPIFDVSASQDFTHGILTVENATDEVLILDHVTLGDATGTIELIDAFAVPPGRPTLWVGSASSFPPGSDNDGLLRQLAGFELAPFPRGEGSERNTEIVLHLRVPAGQEAAGYDSFCVEFSDRDGGRSETCVAHAFFACVDLDGPTCPANEP